MIMKGLSTEERSDFYQSYLIYDFHKNELKPYEFIEELVQRGRYLCFGFFDEKEPLGYAYFSKTDKGRALLLEYFAVVKAHRSKGLGSLFLAEIKNNLNGKYNVLIVEVENPEFAVDEGNKEIRNRRINFYQRNSFRKSNVLSRILREEYLIMSLDLGRQLHNSMLRSSLRHLYRNMYGWKFLIKNINIRTSKVVLP